MKPLYALVEQFRELERLDVEEIDEETLRNTLEGLQGEIAVKATNCAFFVRNLETFADTVEDAARAMQRRADLIRKRAELTRAYMLSNMQASGVTKITAPEFTISVRRNPAAVMIAQDAKLPEKYIVRPPAPAPYPNKLAIKQALKNEEAIDGCYLECSYRLEIK